ncbi:DUF917 domain-containing protein [Leucobacter insecticola]|uniref:DUF917 domain-containing protein n=1 Tax=Leucobacter insecticola TaxID=2714934 RepID=A0A6G8FJQ4_9MICO|nr:DUF917 family protein [Leucobacter insecticola]QIM16292.1 DUF917 domain-containing protein [Leucobacter insecticola]
MPLLLSAGDLPLLASGASFCGSGGGGSPWLTELMVRDSFADSLQAWLPHELDPKTPCFAPAFAGSTLLLQERLPGLNAFEPLISVAEQWLGHHLEAACSFEAGGLNALTPFLFAPDRKIIDADCSGRAVPTVDRTSLYIDHVPGVFAVCSTGAGGVSLTQSERAEDVDRLMRTAMIQAGGAGPVVFAGFTAGDLIRHSLHGHLERSRHIGAALAETIDEPIEALAALIGAIIVGQGRILDLTKDNRDPHVYSAEIGCMDRTVLRVVARSEYLAVLTDGVLVSTAPDYIVAIDVRSREIIEASELRENRHVAILTLPADRWWRSQPGRAGKLLPSTYGLSGLDPEQ